MQERITAIVSGRVQMVMYRDFAQRKARKLGLTGFVRNLSDGTVEVVAEGPPEKFDTFIAMLHDGPPLAQVVSVEATRAPATGEWSDFSLEHGKW